MKTLVLVMSKILCLAILTIPTNCVFAYDLTEYYPLSQGNSWTYLVIEDAATFEYTLKENGEELVEGAKTTRLRSNENEYECFAVDEEGVKAYKSVEGDTYEIFKPPKVIFPNIKVGEAKTYSDNLLIYNMQDINIKKVTGESRILLQSIEDLEVKAGNFNNCLKFSLISEYQEPSGSYVRGDHTVWLAPGVGRVKEFYYSQDYDPETKEEVSSVEIFELISAVIDGVKIGPE